MGDQMGPDVDRWLSAFASALTAGDATAAVALFEPTCLWRDLVSFSWNIVTAEGPSQIAALVRGADAWTDSRTWRTESVEEELPGVISAWFTFETGVARGRGNVRLRGGLCWSLFTSIVELKGFEEMRGRTRPQGADHHPRRDVRDGEAGRGTDRAEQPHCLVIGGGQAGVILAARLLRLGVPTVVVDRHGRAGDVWRGRYEALHLHDPVWFDHFPYLPFPDDWPTFAPGAKVADWIEAYQLAMGLDYRPGTECRSARFDASSGAWEVELERDGRSEVMRPKEVIVATGLFGSPRIPEIPGLSLFTGAQFHTSQRFDVRRFAGRRCVVVGSNTSAHDLAVMLWQAGAEVTMVQRTSTLVVRSSSLLRAMGALYSEDAVERGISVDRADEILASLPLRLLTQSQKQVYQRIAEDDADFYASLDKVGFRHDLGEDGTGIMMAALRGRGFYIDVGGSALIANGDVRLAHGEVVRLGERSVGLSDGQELEADLVVWATGYQSFERTIESIFGAEVATKIGRSWGIGSATKGDPGPWSGELRNMWKPLAHPNLWIMGGNFAWCRYHSRHLALQLKARFEGKDGRVHENANPASRTDASVIPAE